MTRSMTIALLAVGVLMVSVAAQQPTDAQLEIRTLSAKAELVSGGDVLVQIAGPASLTADNVTVSLNGSDVTASFKPVADSGAVVGLLTGLQVGPNAVEASMGDATAQLTVVNHPSTGPVLYSPQQMPFVCETEAHGLGAALDADCSANTKVEYFYRSDPNAPENQGDLAAADNANGFRGGGPSPYKPLDPSGPRPTDILTTTTTEGETVPYIVRREMGTINRAVYSIRVPARARHTASVALVQRVVLERPPRVRVRRRRVRGLPPGALGRRVAWQSPAPGGRSARRLPNLEGVRPGRGVAERLRHPR